jgi:3'(2'), 5'-bisphosphate nucleotidase
MLDLANQEIQFAIESVKRAMSLARQVQAEMAQHSLSKKDKSPVTVADFAIQALVGFELQKYFPQDDFVAEETSSVLRESEDASILERATHYVAQSIPEATQEKTCEWIDHGGGKLSKRFWTLDPIDGTKGFLRGGQYAIALALIEKGEVKLGILGCPCLNSKMESELDGKGVSVIAVKGKGCWALEENEKSRLIPLRVSSCDDPRKALVVNSVEMAHTDVDQFNQVVCALGVQRSPFLMDSLAKHAVVAGGRADLFFRFVSPKEPNRKTEIWDEAAGALIVEEAGGKVTDLNGKKLDFGAGRTLLHNEGIVATNGRLHQAALEALGSMK